MTFGSPAYGMAPNERMVGNVVGFPPPFLSGSSRQNAADARCQRLRRNSRSQLLSFRRSGCHSPLLVGPQARDFASRPFGRFAFVELLSLLRSLLHIFGLTRRTCSRAFERFLSLGEAGRWAPAAVRVHHVWAAKSTYANWAPESLWIIGVVRRKCGQARRTGLWRCASCGLA